MNSTIIKMRMTKHLRKIVPQNVLRLTQEGELHSDAYAALLLGLIVTALILSIAIILVSIICYTRKKKYKDKIKQIEKEMYNDLAKPQEKYFELYKESYRLKEQIRLKERELESLEQQQNLQRLGVGNTGAIVAPPRLRERGDPNSNL